MFNTLDVSGSALTAERTRMDVIAENIANAESTQVAGSEGPYRRQHVMLAQKPSEDPLAPDGSGGVEVVGIVADQSPPRMVYDPSHPDANEQGYVEMPNVDVPTEMVDMIAASRAYEANASALRMSREAVEDALSIMA